MKILEPPQGISDVSFQISEGWPSLSLRHREKSLKPALLLPDTSLPPPASLCPVVGTVRARVLRPVRLCSLTDCSPPGSSVHGISQARILEWVPSPPPGDFPNPGIELASPA